MRYSLPTLIVACLCWFNAHAQYLDNSYALLFSDAQRSLQLSQLVISGKSQESKARAYTYSGTAWKYLSKNDEELGAYPNALEWSVKLQDTLELIKTHAAIGEL